MTRASKPVDPPSVLIRVVIHLSNGRSLAESTELPKDLQQGEDVELHVWMDVSDE